MDQAKEILAYIQVRHPDKGYDVDGVINEIMNYSLKPESVSEVMTETVSVIAKISGKSIKTMYNWLFLLLNHDNIQSAIKAGAIPLSQGLL